jgi:hypothetical protein
LEVFETLAQNLPVNPVGAQSLQEMLGQLVGLFLVAASEDVQNQVAIFRPGMKGYVGLGQERESGDPVGVKLMKPGAQVGQSDLLDCGLDGLM